MLTTLVAACVLMPQAVAPQDRPAAAPPTQTPAELVTRMLARYAAAKTMVGTITLTQTYSGKTATVDTRLQYEKPSFLYVRQDAKVQDGRFAMVVSNGQYFKYTVPAEVNGRAGEMLFESVQQGSKTLDYAGVYAAAGRSYIDRSVPMDIAVARREDLQFINGTWINLQWGDATEVGGQTVWQVTGDWRESMGLNKSGIYSMWINEVGDLVQYEVKEIIKLNPTAPALTMTSTWRVRLEVDGKPDPALFILPK